MIPRAATGTVRTRRASDSRARRGARALVGIALALALAACTSGDEPCGPFGPDDIEPLGENVAITGIARVAPLRLTALGDGGRLEPLAEGATVAAEELVLSLEFALEETAAREPRASFGARLFEWIVPAARACSPPLAPLSASRLRDVALVSGADYAGVGAGDSLAPLAEVLRVDYGTRRVPARFLELFEPLAGAFAASPRAPYRLYLRLGRAPDADAAHAFTALVSLASGEQFEATAAPVTVRGAP